MILHIGNLAHVKFICPLNFPHWPQNGLPFHYFRSYTIAHMQKFPFILANTCFTSPQLATNRRTQAENRFSLVFFSALGSSKQDIGKTGGGVKNWPKSVDEQIQKTAHMEERGVLNPEINADVFYGGPEKIAHATTVLSLQRDPF